MSRTSFADMYWTFAQQLAHATSNGATARPGDLLGSGTVCGPDAGTEGSLIELDLARRPGRSRWPTASSRAFLADGDTVTLRGWCGRRARSAPHRVRRVHGHHRAGALDDAGELMPYYRAVGDVPRKRHTIAATAAATCCTRS